MNEKSEPVRVRVADGDKWKWETVQPGEEADVSKDYGRALGLTVKSMKSKAQGKTVETKKTESEKSKK